MSTPEVFADARLPLAASPAPAPAPPPAYPEDSIYFAWDDCLSHYPQYEDTLLLIRLWRQIGYNDAMKALEEFYQIKEREKAVGVAIVDQERERERGRELPSRKAFLCDVKSAVERFRSQRGEKGNARLRMWEERYKKEQRVLHRGREVRRFWAAVIPILAGGEVR